MNLLDVRQDSLDREGPMARPVTHIEQHKHKNEGKHRRSEWDLNARSSVWAAEDITLLRAVITNFLNVI
jgi:hypothetical protein